MGQFGYYEYKFLVQNEQLPYVKTLLDNLYGGSDPFPSGIVDSIYYDTRDRTFYSQCHGGEALKTKFRIRGYGDGTFNQLHQKNKDMYGVGKLKTRIRPVRFSFTEIPSWDLLKALSPSDEQFFRIQNQALIYGFLEPTVRVKYYRFRYRIFDYRVTLDTNIEITSCSNGLDKSFAHTILPQHVLEIKTTELQPHLPLMGAIKLPQVSFSKYFLGMNLVESNWS